MTPAIAFLFLLLAGMIVLFLTETLPIELTAFCGLLVLVYAGYVPADDAFDGFASSAVITMFSIFFLSAALLQTGVADWLGGRIHDLARGSERGIIALLMLTGGGLSAFMNNVAATAVLLPATSAVARHAGVSPTRLFMPLSFATILGGTITLVGTPPNLLTAEVLVEQGAPTLQLFDFAPIGLTLLLLGTLFMVTLGVRLLPERVEAQTFGTSRLLTGAYRIDERLTTMRIPEGSTLDGMALHETRLGSALDVSVLGIRRGPKKILAPDPETRLEADDLLLVDGRFEDLQRLLGVQGLGVEEIDVGQVAQIAAQIHGGVLRPVEGSGLIGRSLRQLRFRDRFGGLVVGIRRGRDLLRQDLGRRTLRPTDELLVLGTAEQIAALDAQRGLELVSEPPISELLEGRLFVLRLPTESTLAGSTVRESRLGELAGLTIVGRVRDGRAELAIDSGELLVAGDELLVAGEPTRITELLGLGQVELEEELAHVDLESRSVRVVEAVVAPRSRAAGQTLRKWRFRERYGMQVLAILREGRAIHQDLAAIPLRVGDALLLHGRIERLPQLSADDDFVVLSHDVPPVRRYKKAWVALAALAAMIGLVVTGLTPIHVAAFTGAVFAVLFGALTMEEAYRAVEWRALFLIAAILPVGQAMQTSGAAELLAGGVTGIASSYGPYAFLAVLVLLSSFLSQTLDGAPTVVILAPVVGLTAASLDLSPTPFMVAVGLGASAAFMTPFSHKGNLLIMSAGGYRSIDFLRVGTPLTLVMMGVIVLLVPWFFPF